MALSSHITREDADRLERMRTLTTYLAVLLALLMTALVFLLITEDVEPGGLFSLAALLAGLRFVLVARGFQTRGTAKAANGLKTTYQLFIGLFVASWLSILILRGYFAPIEFLGIAMVVAAIYLMIQIQSDARRVALAESSPAVAPTAATPAAAQSSAQTGQSATETLRELAQLRDSGVLTEAEFQEKKADLLKRI